MNTDITDLVSGMQSLSIPKPRAKLRQRDILFKKYYQDDNVVDYLENYNLDCDSYKRHAVAANEINTGSYGKIFSITIDNKPYIIKEIPLKRWRIYEEDLPGLSVEERRRVRAYGEKLKLHVGAFCKTTAPKTITKNIDFPYQIIDKDPPKKTRSGDEWDDIEAQYPPTKQIYGSIKKDQYTIPARSYICDQTYTEYMIMTLLSDIKKGNMGQHFLNTFDFNTCDNLKQYYAMERIDTTLSDLIDASVTTPRLNFTPNDYMSIVLQTLFTIATFQELYKINHNDLHSKNIFIKLIKLDRDYTHDEYKIVRKNKIIKTYYIPASRYFVKIGDFGLACKYTKPIIAYNDIANGRISSVPNWYCPSFDLVIFLISIINLIRRMKQQLYSEGDAKVYESQNFKTIRFAKFVNKKLMSEIENTGGKKSIIKYQWAGPQVSPYLDTLKSASKLLKDSKFLETFTKRPVNGSIRRNVYTLILA